MKYILILFLLIGVKTSAQIEPSTVIENFVVSTIRWDSLAMEKWIIKDSVVKNFCLENSIKPKDSIDCNSAFFYYRLSFFGSFGVFLDWDGVLNKQTALISDSKFKAIIFEKKYVVADYFYTLAKTKKRKYRFTLRYIDIEGWKITSIKLK